LYGPEAQDLDGVSVDVSESRDESQVAVISDDVVVLRRWSRSDAEFIAEACNDPAIQRYSSPALSIGEAAELIESFGRKWTGFVKSGNPTGVAFAVVDAASGELAGLCGVDEWSTAGVAQIGYWLAAAARRRGFATRAVVLLTGWLFQLGAARVFLTVVSENVDSIAVARGAGFTYEGTLRSHGVWQGSRRDVDVFGALPDEWAARGGI